MVGNVALPMVGLTAGAAVWWLGVAAGSLVDLGVFREAARVAVTGGSPYIPVSLPFAYPPAGLLVSLLTLVGADVRAAGALWAAVSLAALGRTVWILTAAAWPAAERRTAILRSCWIFAVACALEPTVLCVAFGQMGLLLLWLTVEGLLPRPDTGRAALVGVATAIKLTPGFLIIAFAGARRWRTVAWAVIGLAASTLLAWALFPTAVGGYLAGGWRLASDANTARDAQNHSVAGVAAVLGAPSLVAWSVIVLLGFLGVAAASRCLRRGDQLAGVSAALAAGLLVSPVSWTHHWVACYPALVLLMREWRVRRGTAPWLLIPAMLGMLFWVDLIGNAGNHIRLPGTDWPWSAVLQQVWYPVWAGVFLCWVMVGPAAMLGEHARSAQSGSDRLRV